MSDWMPGADVFHTVAGGSMNGPAGIRAVVWHTTENSPGARPRDVASWVASQRSEYHAIWNPYTGAVTQLLPASQSARSLKNDGTYQTNRVGELRVQIACIGRAAESPLATSPLVGYERVRAWLADLGIPETDVRDERSRSRSAWSRSGWTTHASAPANNHVDPGFWDTARLWATGIDLGEDMPIIVKTGTKSAVFISGARSRVITSKTEKQLRAAGIPSVKIDSKDYDAFKSWSRPAE